MVDYSLAKELEQLIHHLKQRIEILAQKNQELAQANKQAIAEVQYYKALSDDIIEQSIEIVVDDDTAGYVITNHTGRIQRVNRKAAQVLQREIDYLHNLPLVVLVHRDDQNKFRNLLAAVQPDHSASTREIQECTLWFQTRSTKVLHAALTVQPMSLNQLQICWTIREIQNRTEQNRTEQNSR